MAKWQLFPFGPLSTHNVIGSCWVQHEDCDVHMHLLSQCSNSLGILPTCNKVCSSLCSCSKPSDNICCCIYVQGIRPVLPRIFRSKVTQGPSLEEWGRDVWISMCKSNNYSIYSKHTCFCFVVPVLFILHAGGKNQVCHPLGAFDIDVSP